MDFLIAFSLLSVRTPREGGREGGRKEGGDAKKKNKSERKKIF